MEVKEYKYLKRLQTLSVTFMLAALVLSHKIINIFGVQFSVASLIFPNTILITNIVSIVYGYKSGFAVMWEALKCQIPFTIICFIAINLPSTSSDISYQYIFKDLWRVSIASLLGTYIGLKSNIYVLSKFDRLLLRNNIWLRTLFACGVGEIIFTIIAVPLMFLGKVSFKELLSIVAISLLVKIIYSSFLSHLAEVIASFLIKSEGVLLETNKFNYDPFTNLKLTARNQF